jgi:hypothetical protein
MEDPPSAAAEIRRRGADRRFVQVLFMGRAQEPMGRRKYWPIYEACAETGVHVASHAFGAYGHPITGAGHASFYIEDHTSPPQAIQANITSMVVEGVFDRFPSLKLISVENGFGWMPSLLWRLDASWTMLRAEVPHLVRRPSEIVRERVWLSTQPIEEPHRPEQLLQLLDHYGDLRDHLMLASDYPHWAATTPTWCCRASCRRSSSGGSASRTRASSTGSHDVKHVVATADEIPPGGRKLVELEGRSIGVFNLDGEYSVAQPLSTPRAARCAKESCGSAARDLRRLRIRAQPRSSPAPARREFTRTARGAAGRGGWVRATRFQWRRARPRPRIPTRRAPAWSRGRTQSRPTPFRSTAARRSPTWSSTSDLDEIPRGLRSPAGLVRLVTAVGGRSGAGFRTPLTRSRSAVTSVRDRRSAWVEARRTERSLTAPAT